MVTAAERVKPYPALEQMLADSLRSDRARRDERRGEKQRDHLYVSEVGTFTGDTACLRKLWYSFHNAPQEPLDDNTLVNFTLGDVWGLRIANILSAGGAVQKLELPLDFPGYPISG